MAFDSFLMQSCELVTTAILGNCSLIDFFWLVGAVLFDQFEIVR